MIENMIQFKVADVQTACIVVLIALFIAIIAANQICILRETLLDPMKAARAIMSEFQRKYNNRYLTSALWAANDEMLQEKINDYMKELEKELGYYIPSQEDVDDV